jgi:predicted Zn-dependent peptidase
MIFTVAEPKIFQHTYPNGLTLLAERMDHVRSATFTFLVPAGFTNEPGDQLGLASVFAEMIMRGAGHRDSEKLSIELDNLGTDRSESVGPFNVNLAAGTLARNVPETLRIYADIIRRPHLPEEELESVQDALLQDLVGLEDSPQDLVMMELKRRFYPGPFNRHRYGTAEGIRSVTGDHIHSYFRTYFQPRGAILSVAGAIDWPQLQALVGELFGEWSPVETPPIVMQAPIRTSTHLVRDTQQTQISLAIPSANFTDPDYYAARGAVGVLSGGMSARLFTEVREKRGLCYSVYASHEVIKGHAALVCYSGTRADRAQETLDVILAELHRLKQGIASEELDRLKASLKTALVMQQESTGARASSMASDWFNLGRVRPVDEIQTAINSLNEASILGYLERFPIVEPTIVTLGTTPLAM